MSPSARPRWAWLAVGASVVLLAGACSATSSARGSGEAVGVRPATQPTVWLCQPGRSPDPCTGNLDATAVDAHGATTPMPSAADPAAPFDCFYVYPTVSKEPADNADLAIQPAETATAERQASRFSSVCQVWAPMYRQITLRGLARGFTAEVPLARDAYASLLSGWNDYLAHHNNGRPIVFIGHSQGAAMLIDLLRQVVDPDPRLRQRLVSAVILGGNVQVPTGRTTGGTFRHIPLCTSPGRPGCVIAYSTFGSPPPPTALFGRPGKGFSLLSGQTRSSGQQVACTNPADLTGGLAALAPYSPTSQVPPPSQAPAGLTVPTPWVTYPGLYTATCRSAGGATWLQVTAAAGPGDPRPEVKANLGPTWGYHGDDVNLALGNLVTDVASEEKAYLATGPATLAP